MAANYFSCLDVDDVPSVKSVTSNPNPKQIPKPKQTHQSQLELIYLKNWTITEDFISQFKLVFFHPLSQQSCVFLTSNTLLTKFIRRGMKFLNSTTIFNWNKKTLKVL